MKPSSVILASLLQLQILFGCYNKFMMKKILVLCTGNSCRSQIAEGYLKYFAEDKAVVYSAGVETHGVNKMAIQTMLEDGIDISNQTSNHVDEYLDIEFDFVITVCDNAKEKCPYFPVKSKIVHKNFEDPSKFVGSEAESKERFRESRNQIKAFCRTFVSDYIL